MSAAMILKVTPEMDETRQALVEAINSKAAEDPQRFNLKALSLKMLSPHGKPRGATYLYDFLYKSTPRSLRLEERLQLLELLGIEEGALMSADEIQRIGVPNGRPIQRAPTFTYEARDLPIMGRAQGVNGDVITLAGERVGTTERPSYLEGVGDAFAVYVAGESMAPRYRPGELVYVNTVRPPVAGDDVLIEFLDGTGILKELVKISSHTITVKQHNPAQQKTLDRKNVKNIRLIQGMRPRT